VIPTTTITRIKELVDLAALVSGYTPLKKSGAQHLVRCPAHKDTNPSCRIYKDHWYCFTCGAHGSAIDWVMLLDGVNFREAMKTLADRCGVSLEEKPITAPERSYAASEAALCLWWWERKRAALMALAHSELQQEDADQAYLGTLYCARVSIDATGPTERWNLFCGAVTREDRREYARKTAEEEAWLAAWMDLPGLAYTGQAPAC
jgi:CHC2 zinc finger